ncbi:hypothetical protein VTN77DRAFT_7868 [Rasamsonia byssochlamydoides]|uniref:uncharacterized protein n=1 Tax=Rasamsonia byssochlamydoides TaxID=89139 RepID=UPI003743B23A
MGPWAKDPYYKKVGIWMLLQSEPGFKASAMAVLTRFERWSNVEVEILAAGALNDAKNPKIHGILDL